MAKTFDLINNLSNDKKEIPIDDEFKKEYNAFLTNRFFSYFKDTVLLANTMNMCPELTDEQRYLFYFYKVKPRKRFSKWFKITPDKNIDIIQEYYSCNTARASEILKILSDDDIKYICKILNKGGTKVVA